MKKNATDDRGGLGPSHRATPVIEWEALARHMDQETSRLGCALRHRDADHDGIDDPPFIAVFASARTAETAPRLHSEYGEIAHTLGRELATRGFSMLTGGCPGIVDEAQRLFVQHRLAPQCQLSVGIRIKALDFEEPPNPNLDHCIYAPVFGTRLELMNHFVEGAIVLPGGFGSLLELAFFLQYSQVSAKRAMPICLVGKFWRPLKAVIALMKAIGTVNGDTDLSFLHFVDTAEEALDIIEDHNGIGERVRSVREQLRAAI